MNPNIIITGEQACALAQCVATNDDIGSAAPVSLWMQGDVLMVAQGDYYASIDAAGIVTDAGA